jgi:hypothetical protein
MTLQQLLARIAAVCLALILTHCGSAPAPKPEPVELVTGVGDIELQQAAATPEEAQLLDIGVVVFASAPQQLDDQRYGEGVFTEVRDNERHLLPFNLRQTLLQSNQWGAVRILPQEDPAVDLTVTGTVLRSDGQLLELNILARDATGRVWLNETYTDVAQTDAYPEPLELRRADQRELQQIDEPFADLYAQIANDLVNARRDLSTAQLNEIRQVALLVFANDLSPQSFSDMLREENDRLRVTSLPAAEDPMLERVRAMRVRHHLFIDTVDEYYQALYDDMHSPYLIWRSYSHEQVLEDQRAAQRDQDQSRYSSTSGYLTLTQRYDRYRWAKIYQQEYQELASGFNREAAPAILELNQQVRGLSGTLEEQYIQWRRILRELFMLETGQEADS